VNAREGEKEHVAGGDEEGRVAALEGVLRTLSPGRRDERLTALRALVALHPRTEAGSGANLHLHTGESYSLFGSPAALVWAARQEGLAVVGINDLYATGGHEEFVAACRIAGLAATRNVELIALDPDAAAAGRLWNDPNNPGRTYLCGKGVLGPAPAGSAEAAWMERITAALRRRHEQMTVLASAWLTAHGCGPIPWQAVAARTARGNVTERHIAEAMADAVRAATGDAWQRAVRDWFDADATAESLPLLLRSRLLKAAGPAYVPESPDSFMSWPQARRIFLAMGAIPTYPILGDPVTDGEADVEALFDHLSAGGWHAVEVIPRRNTPARLGAIVQTARARRVPCFAGTEHNTKDRLPLRDPSLLDPAHRDWYERSARVLLGHQRLTEAGAVGYVDADGNPSAGDPEASARRCLQAAGDE
jgi:hypothetical protein